MTTSLPVPVSLLILGAGWTSTFLLPLLTSLHIPHAATSTTGRPGTIKFIFSPTSSDPTPYLTLPSARTILITFPLKGREQSAHLLHLYANTHSDANPPPQYIQLGSTGIFSGVPRGESCWVTRHSRYDTDNQRAIAEDELMALGGCVLNLSGLWGGERRPWDWIGRVAPSKETLGAKSSLHVVHGDDVARAVVAVSEAFTKGERWLITDLIVYDWWELALGWAGEHGNEDGENGGESGKQYLRWIQEMMEENSVRALPRSPEQLERCYDSREFWTRFKLMPVRARI